MNGLKKSGDGSQAGLPGDGRRPCAGKRRSGTPCFAGLRDAVSFQYRMDLPAIRTVERGTEAIPAASVCGIPLKAAP